MHDHVDVAVRDAEQQVRLDHLETLVHERRRVGGDDAPHVPGRVGERLGRGDSRERLAGAPAERAAGCRQHQPPNLGMFARSQGLRDGGMLGVDRHDLTRAARAR